MNIPFHKEIFIALADVFEDPEGLGFCKLGLLVVYEGL